MHTNYVWLGFLGAAALVILAFCLSTAKELTAYFSVGQASHTEILDWRVQERSNSRFYIIARYRYQVDGKEFESSHTFKDHSLRNPWAAKKKITEMEHRTWTAWYSPKRPHLSTLDRHFPLRRVISSLFLVGIYLYFIGLGYYVGKLTRPA